MGVGVWVRRSKSRGVKPLFGVYKGLVVVLWGGWSRSEELRFKIFNLDYDLRWYISLSEGLRLVLVN